MTANQQTSHSVRVRLALSPVAAWEKLRDLRHPHCYVPDLDGTTLRDGPAEGVGASRCVRRKGGGTLDETVTRWLPGEGFDIRLHQGDRPLKPFRSASFSYRLEAVDGHSLAHLSIHYAMPWGALGRWLDRRLIAPAMRKTLCLTAAGLKHFYETDTAAGHADRERLLPEVELL